MNTAFLTHTARARTLPRLGAVLCLFALSGGVHAVTFAWISVGDVGNPTDPGNLAFPNTHGAVGYLYRMATHEVTNAQYAEFLNAVARTDPNGLYSSSMGSDATFGGITQSGVSGSFAYSVKASFDLKPVTYTSWLDAARFANWLHNGQPAGAQGPGTTEIGAYDMSVSFSMRLPGAAYFLPSEDEWYKAAYYAPGMVTGDGDSYWQYPTKSDTAPTAEAPPGGANSANYLSQSGGVLSNVGAYIGTSSHYRVFDMGGNVSEWTEASVGSPSRRLRGGSWEGDPVHLRSGLHTDSSQANEFDFVGFRVASIPEPATASLMLMALVILGCRRRRG